MMANASVPRWSQQSGMGREGYHYGLASLETKYICRAESDMSATEVARSGCRGVPPITIRAAPAQTR